MNIHCFSAVPRAQQLKNFELTRNDKMNFLVMIQQNFFVGVP